MTAFMVYDVCGARLGLSRCAIILKEAEAFAIVIYDPSLLAP